MESGAFRDAEQTYEAALKRTTEREDRIELWMALGRCLVSQDRQAAAEAAFRKVVRAAPDSAMAAEAQMEIVQGHLDRGRLPDAIRELERMAKAFKGSPQAAQALFMSGNCWEGLGNDKKAEEAYRKVLDTAPQSQWAGEAQRALLRILEEAR
jgi:TolA-binding protein